MASNQFTEQQSIPSAWRVLIFGGITLMMVIIGIMTYVTEWETMPASEKPYLLTLLLGPIGAAVMFFVRLDIKITSGTIEYKVHPFRKTYRVIPMNKITQIELLRPRGLKSMVGVGTKRNLNRTELNFGGKYLVIVTMAKGRVLSFTTNKPQEISSFLNNLPEGSPKVSIQI